MTDLTEEELAAYRATCARREAAERRRQQARRAAGRQAARCAATLLREQFGAERVVLFGSLARTEDLGPRSDIDLAVAGISAEDYYQAVARVQRVAEERSIDLVRLENCAPSLRERIDEEGIPL